MTIAGATPLPPGAVNPHRSPPTSPLALVGSFWRNRQLIAQMTKREVLSRYRGSIFGLAWSFFNPLLMLVIYTFVFSEVFKARWGLGGDESKVDFAIVLFVGLIVHGLLAECLARAPALILSNVSYVKKVVFPLEILAWVALGTALFHAAVSLIVLLVAKSVAGLPPTWSVLLTPIVFAPLMIGTMGITWFVASLGVYLRDVQPTIGIIVTALLFLSPVFYPAAVLPEQYRYLLFLNPLTFIIEQARVVLIWNQMPDWGGLALYTAGSCVIAWLGFWWFQRTRRGFADVV